MSLAPASRAFVNLRSTPQICYVLHIMITFFLACWMFYAVCLGLIIASMAGVAYGYNYSMAEFLTFTRSDTAVYMRRGQFFDAPDVMPKTYRRAGEGEDGFQNPNPPSDVADYEDKKPRNDPQPLPDTWMKAQDTRSYAEKLTNYKPDPAFVRKNTREEAVQVDLTPEKQQKTRSPPDYYKLTSMPFKTKRISISPHSRLAVSTSVWQDGNSNIVMRNFQMSTKELRPEQYEIEYGDDEQRPIEDGSFNPSGTPYPSRTDPDASEEESKRPQHDIRHWTSTTPFFQDYSEDIDEDKVVYKPA